MTEVALAAIASRLLDQIEVLTTELVNSILESVAEYDIGTTVSGDDLRESCRDNLERVIASLAHPIDPEFDLDAPRRTGISRARQGVPLASVLQSYRLGGRIIWEAMLRDWASHDSQEEALEIASLVWVRIDEYSVAVSTAYSQEANLLSAYKDRQLQTALTETLEGAGGDVLVARRLAKTFGLKGSDRLCLALTGDHPDVGAALITVNGPRCEVLAQAIHAGRWVALLRTDATNAREIQGSLVGVAEPKVVLSPVFGSIADANSAYLNASLAYAAVRMRGGGVYLLEDAFLEALVAESPETTKCIENALIAPIVQLGHEGSSLLDTLAAYLACDGSVAETAKKQFLHRNSVTKRLARISQLTGVSTTGIFDRALWVMALIEADRLDGSGRSLDPHLP